MERADMKQCIVDCSAVRNPEEFHDYLVEVLTLPDWYGTNLDALYDCLTSITEETHITLVHFDQLEDMYAGFRDVFEDAAGSNPRIQITIE
jgi:ribonuclease inhibitor